MTTDTVQEPQELSEDEQFAVAIKGNPLFDGAPETTTEKQTDPNTTAPAAGDGAAAAGAPANDDGQQPSTGDASAQTAPTAAAEAPNDDDGGASAPAQVVYAEPFPGYNALPAEAREAFDKLASERGKYENDYRALHGMTAPLQRQNSDLQNKNLELSRQHAALVGRIQQLEQLERKGQNVSAAKDKALQEVDEWARQYPEESQAVLAMVNPLREKVTALESVVNAQRAELGTLQNERQQAALARELNALTAAHGDWQEISDSPEYWEWLQRQTPGIQSLNQSMFAGDTIQLLNLFKVSRAPAQASTPAAPTSVQADAVQQRRTQNLARGTQPKVRTSESPIRGSGSQAALTDEDAQFASLVADNPNFR